MAAPTRDTPPKPRVTGTTAFLAVIAALLALCAFQLWRVADKPVAPAVDEPRRVFEAIGRLEPTDPKAAFRKYRELAAGGGPFAPNALFAIARLSASVGDRDNATAYAREYRYHQGYGNQNLATHLN